MPTLFLTSRVLPFAHGFSVREGGVSEGPFASLNLGFSVGDERPRVEENLTRFATALGVGVERLATVSQVHGDRVLEAPPTSVASGVQPVLGEADALWTEAERVAVGVKTADCVPILIADERTGRVAAIHSGWRGTDAKIAARTVEALIARGSRPEDLVAAIGPSIQKCCYEVSDDLAQRFTERFGPEVVTRPKAQPHLDLSLAVRQTLERAGLPATRIDVLPHCTACDAKQFFSHRRDQGRSGRHLSAIVSPGPRRLP